MCVAATHYSRCFATPYKKKTLGSVLKQHYSNFRELYPWSSSLPVGTDGSDPHGAHLSRSADESELTLIKELGGASKFDDVDARSKVANFKNWNVNNSPVEPHQWEADAKKANLNRDHATFVDNVKHVLAYCGSLYNSFGRCSHAVRLARWLGTEGGAMHRELVFGDLRWLGSALFAQKTTSTEKVTHKKFVPLGCKTP